MSDVLYDALIARNAANSAVFSVLDDGAEVSFAVFVGRVAQLWRNLKHCVGSLYKVSVLNNCIRELCPQHSSTITVANTASANTAFQPSK
jgi:hypothetical protein